MRKTRREPSSVDIEAVFDDRGELGLEKVVVDFLVPRGVDVKHAALPACHVADGDGAKPQAGHDVVKVRQSRKHGAAPLPVRRACSSAPAPEGRGAVWLETESRSAPMPETSSSAGSPPR